MNKQRVSDILSLSMYTIVKDNTEYLWFFKCMFTITKEEQKMAGKRDEKGNLIINRERSITINGGLNFPVDYIQQFEVIDGKKTQIHTYKDLIVQDILNEENTEIRRILVAMYNPDEGREGEEAFMVDLMRLGNGKVVLDEPRTDVGKRTVYKLKIEDTELLYLRMEDSTQFPKEFWETKSEQELLKQGLSIDGREIYTEILVVGADLVKEILETRKTLDDIIGFRYGKAVGGYAPEKCT